MYDVNDSVVQAVHYGKGSLNGDQSKPANFSADDFTDLVTPGVQAPQVIQKNRILDSEKNVR